MYTKTTAILAIVGIGALMSSCGSDAEQAPKGEDAEHAQKALGDVLPEVDCPDSLKSCTANDVVTEVVDTMPIGGDDCSDGFLNAAITLQFTSTANERYDMSVIITGDGEFPTNSELCFGERFQAGDGDGDNLFLSLNPLDGTNFCGDLEQSVPVQVIREVTVSCDDFNPSGELFVDSCRAWQHNANQAGPCDPTTDPDAGTGSKCDCTPLVLEVDPCILPNDCTVDSFCNPQTCDSSSGVAVCVDSPAPNCNDGVACTIDTCNDALGACVNMPDSSLCDDGLACTGIETCTASGCMAGTPVVCNDGLTCTNEVCTEPSGTCVSSDNGFCGTLVPTPDPSTGCVCSCECVF